MVFGVFMQVLRDVHELTAEQYHCTAVGLYKGLVRCPLILHEAML